MNINTLRSYITHHPGAETTDKGKITIYFLSKGRSEQNAEKWANIIDRIGFLRNWFVSWGNKVLSDLPPLSIEQDGGKAQVVAQAILQPTVAVRSVETLLQKRGFLTQERLPYAALLSGAVKMLVNACANQEEYLNYLEEILDSCVQQNRSPFDGEDLAQALPLYGAMLQVFTQHPEIAPESIVRAFGNELGKEWVNPEDVKNALLERASPAVIAAIKRNKAASVLLEFECAKTLTAKQCNVIVKVLNSGGDATTLRSYLLNCERSRQEPFSEVRLQHLQSHLAAVAELDNRAEWQNELKKYTKNSVLIECFLGVSDTNMPVSSELAKGVKGVFKQINAFAEEHPHFSPTVVVGAFFDVVYVLGAKIESKEVVDPYWLEKEVVPQLTSGTMFKKVLHAELIARMEEKKMPQEEIPLLVELIQSRLKLGSRTSVGQLQVIDGLLKLLADTKLSFAEKQLRLKGIDLAYLDLREVTNSATRIKAITHAFTEDRVQPVFAKKLLEKLTSEPEAVVESVMSSLQNFYEHDQAVANDALRKQSVDEIVQGIKKSDPLKFMLSGFLEKVPKELLGTTSLVTLQSEHMVQIDVAGYAAQLVADLQADPVPTDSMAYVLMEKISKFACNREKIAEFRANWSWLDRLLHFPLIKKFSTSSGMRRVLPYLSRPIRFIANKVLDKNIDRAGKNGKHDRAEALYAMKELVTPVLAIVMDLAPGIVQKHPMLCFGETEPNLLGAIDLFLNASQNPDFATSQALQQAFLNELKPYIVALVREFAVYGPMVDEISASILKLGR